MQATDGLVIQKANGLGSQVQVFQDTRRSQQVALKAHPGPNQVYGFTIRSVRPQFARVYRSTESEVADSFKLPLSHNPEQPVKQDLHMRHDHNDECGGQS